MIANVPAISIGQPCASAIVKKGKQVDKPCSLWLLLPKAAHGWFERE